MRNIFNSENVTEEDAREAYEELTEIQNVHTAKKFEKERDDYKKEFFESNSESINSDAVKKAEIIIPHIEEQQAIGTYFKNLDTLITLHQRK